MKFFMITSTQYEIKYHYANERFTDNQKEAPTLFATEDEAWNLISENKWNLKEACDDRWWGSFVVEVELKLN